MADSGVAEYIEIFTAVNLVYESRLFFRITFHSDMYLWLGGLIVISTAVDLILIFRDWDYLATLVVTAIITSTILRNGNIIAVPGVGCADGALPPSKQNLLRVLQAASLGITLALHTTLFLLTVVKASTSYARDSGVLTLRNVLKNDRSAFPLLVSFLRDGTMYFAILFVTTVLVTLGAADPHLTTLYPIIIIPKMSNVDKENEDGPAVSRSIYFAQAGGVSNQSEENY
ncbi:hypothetical protein BDQ17DRAFT_1333740 [Cyathus striatus]|nr:hypothetical protein BDQ17DRAFT_1333740 [Cyathus striatus]